MFFGWLDLRRVFGGIQKNLNIGGSAPIVPALTCSSAFTTKLVLLSGSF